MIFDINAYLGHFALRELRHNTAFGLLALMDDKGINSALVSSASAITYKDCHAGNEQLMRELNGGSDRLLPCAVLNPAYAGWRRDLETCVNEFGMRALKLYPHWHNYALADTCCDEIVCAATELGLPILIPMRAVDSRQLGWLFDVPDMAASDIVALVRRRPEARFVILNGIGLIGSELITDRENLPDNYWIEVSRLSLFIGRELPQLLEALGPERLLFGTGMPFKYIDPVLLKMEKLEATADAKEMIFSENALDLLAKDAVL